MRSSRNLLCTNDSSERGDPRTLNLSYDDIKHSYRLLKRILIGRYTGPSVRVDDSLAAFIEAGLPTHLATSNARLVPNAARVTATRAAVALDV